MTTTGPDIATVLRQDHAAVRTLLDGFDTLATERRDQAFCEIVHELVRHEVAEEEVVYPALRRQAGGEAIADARIAEQSKAEELLDRMEKAGVDSPEFPTMFAQLRTDVLAHAQAEEATALPALAAAVSPEEQAELADRYERAKKLAPTHPHPHAPDTPPGNVLLGPVAALMDKVRDAMSGSRSG